MGKEAGDRGHYKAPVQVIITHIQYFIIVTRLNVDYPAIIGRCQSVLSAITGAENYIAWSPTCLFPHLRSAGQAAVQLCFGFMIPCMVSVVVVVCWTLRRCTWAYLQPFRSLIHADQSLSLAHQLAVVLIIASFILYPSLCQTSLGIFACYIIDSGAGAFKENQKASWRHGYWVRDMQQRCYDGIHHRVYMPIGVASTVILCLGLPLTYFVLVWRCRHNLKDVLVQIKYGFLYVQYKPRFFWWAAVLQVQTLALVAVQTFGRTVVVLQQAMLLATVLNTNAAITMTCSPVRFPLNMVLEFLSSAVLSLTVIWSLAFLEESSSSLPSSAAVRREQEELVCACLPVPK
ncbi:hypothetical protein TSOC_003875 [Tetrabaena socialis]|uniref:Uncharacterized protein n=1 Tax=Tetrabaena socialis TaxID=47790 RepID=A0A2J8AAF7_9CHLO|nr:hypothetical protein TSOC_003875 [Tetrabaena socialis]|eukprot:PNH09491.1 hypothetical protein TSOC_003875 [Tetrabaena socialis]